MKLTSPELQSRLAAEYVLGTMTHRTRRRFEEHMLSSASLREEVAKWEAHLTPLALRVEPIAPPDRVWKKIEARTTGGKIGAAKTQVSTGVSEQNAAKAHANTGLFGSLAFWRNWGLGASGLAAALIVASYLGMMPANEPMMMAVLEDQGVARMVVEQPKPGILMVKMVKPWKAAPDNSMELWVIPKDGKPRSLGVVNDTGETKLATHDMDARMTDGLVFALSKEPKGGSPTGQPTGAILCKGAIAKMPNEKTAKAKSQI
jgi:anti-sigma-K factor RskA